MTKRISSDGRTITLHRAEGAKIRFRLRNRRTKTDQDVSADDLVFAVEGAFQTVLIADPENPTGRIISITPEQLATVPAVGASFKVVNRSVEPPKVLWWGRFRVEGFVQ